MRGKAKAAKAALKYAILPLNSAVVAGLTAISRPSALSAYCVWRSANAQVVSAFIRTLPPNTAVHLHQLEPGPAGRLANLTRSRGPGLRMPLLGELIGGYPPRPDDHVLIFDDDVRFIGRGATRFPAIALAAGFDLSQPSHTPFSPSTFPVNQTRLLSIARETGFVEVGPVVLMSPAAWSRAIPFPDDMGMGWGLDVEWTMFRSIGLRLGVVDATPIRHLGEVAAEYGSDAEREVLESRLRMVGANSIEELTHQLGRSWRPWRRKPPWSR